MPGPIDVDVRELAVAFLGLPKDRGAVQLVAVLQPDGGEWRGGGLVMPAVISQELLGLGYGQADGFDIAATKYSNAPRPIAIMRRADSGGMPASRSHRYALCGVEITP